MLDGGKVVENNQIAVLCAENFLLKAEPVNHDARAESILVALQLLPEVFRVSLGVSERRFAFNPVDDCVLVQALDGEEQVRCFVEPISPQIAFIVERQPSISGQFLQFDFVFLPDSVANHVDDDPIVDVVVNAGSR